MRPFEHFPDHAECVVCKTNQDKPCILVPIDGTEDGGNIEATPIHVDCIDIRYKKENNLLYMLLD